MPVYMSRFKQSSATWSRLMKNPEDRRKVVGALAEKAGGKLLGYWYAFGDHDGVALFELPDNVSAASLLVPVAASGDVSIETTVMLTVEEMQDALKRAGQITYRPPGA